MKNVLRLLVLLALPAEAMGACCCVTGIIHRYGNGDAICQCRRYETGDCEAGQCKRPRDVSEFRPYNQTAREVCPRCRPYRSSAPSAFVAGANPGGEDDHPEQRGEVEGRVQPEGLPVAEDFNPIEEKRIDEENSRAEPVGFFTLHMKDKIATNIESDSAVPVGKDIEVKIFRVKLPFNEDVRFIAYEFKREKEQPKDVDRTSITNVRYNPNDGDRILMLNVSDKNLPQLMGKDVFLLRGPN